MKNSELIDTITEAQALIAEANNLVLTLAAQNKEEAVGLSEKSVKLVEDTSKLTTKATNYLQKIIKELSEVVLDTEVAKAE